MLHCVILCLPDVSPNLVTPGQLSLLSSAGSEMSTGNSLRVRGEGLVWLIGVVVCLLAATAGPIVR